MKERKLFCLFVNSAADVTQKSPSLQEDKELNKNSKNPELGKLTEADKASTGQVGGA